MGTLEDVLPETVAGDRSESWRRARRVTLNIEGPSPFQGLPRSRRSLFFLGNHLSGHSHGAGSGVAARPDIHAVHSFRNGAAGRRVSCESPVALRQGSLVYSAGRRDHNRHRKRMSGVRGIVGAQWTRGAVYNDFAFLDDRTGSSHSRRRTLARTNSAGDVGRAGRHFASIRSQRHAAGPQRPASQGFPGPPVRLLWLVPPLPPSPPPT